MQISRLFQRSAVVRIAALASIVAVPFVLHGRLDMGVEAARASVATAEVVAPAPSAPAPAYACATEHWPFYSKDCLRSADPAVAPRQLSLEPGDAQTPTTAPSAMAAYGKPKLLQAHALQVVRPQKPRRTHVAARRRHDRYLAPMPRDDAGAGFAPAFASTW